jgi:hypothetical protein
MVTYIQPYKSNNLAGQSLEGAKIQGSLDGETFVDLVSIQQQAIVGYNSYTVQSNNS